MYGHMVREYGMHTVHPDRLMSTSISHAHTCECMHNTHTHTLLYTHAVPQFTIAALFVP